MKKRLLSVLLALVMVLSCFGSYAALAALEPDNATYYYYNQLSANEKLMYDKIVYGFQNGSTTVNVHVFDGLETEFTTETTITDYTAYSAFISSNATSCAMINAYYNALEAFELDHVEITWLVSGGYYTVSPTFAIGVGENYVIIYYMQLVFDMTDTSNQSGAMETVLKSIKATGSDAEKVKTIHDFICANVTYDYSNDNYFNAYGALCEGKAIYQGYARAFKLACDYYDVECVCVTGSGGYGSSYGYHVWNAVCIDEIWYNVDMGWDDWGSSASYDYFLVGNDTLCYYDESFTESHISNGYQSSDSEKEFTYPAISDISYDEYTAQEQPSPTPEVIVTDIDVYCYYYEQLTDNEKTMYNALLKGYTTEVESVNVPIFSGLSSAIAIPSGQQPSTVVSNSVTAKTMENAFSTALEAFALDHTEISWLVKNGTYTITRSWTYSYTSTTVKLNCFVIDFTATDTNNEAAAMKNVISGMNITGTDEEKVKIIHDYLCDNVEYDISATNRSTAYGALCDGKAVCQGYAQAFKLACDYSGIKCVCITGQGGYGDDYTGHMWNAVYIENAWYYVDATWDDQKTAIYYDYYLVGTDSPGFEDEKFCESHIASGYQQSSSVKEFTYPTGSKISLAEAKEATPFTPIENAGDVNDNGVVDDEDLLILTRYLAGWNGYDALCNTLRADINNDGSVTPLDRAILARYIASWSGYEQYFE